MAGIGQQAEELQKQLGKRATFESAVKQLGSLVEQEYGKTDAPGRRALFTATSRAATLLQTRYTSKGFWLAGYRLFSALKSATRDPQEKKHLEDCLARANEHLGDDEMMPQSLWPGLIGGRQREGFLFEGQLSGSTSAQPATTNHDNILDLLISGIVAQENSLAATDVQSEEQEVPSEEREAPPEETSIPSGTVQSAEVPSQVNTTGGVSSIVGSDVPSQSNTAGEVPSEVASDVPSANIAGNPELLRAAIRRAEAQERENRNNNNVAQNSGVPVEENGAHQGILRAILENLQGVNGQFVGLEEALAASVNEQGRGTAGPPPAAKEEVKKLPVMEMSAERLAALGPGTECAVCKEHLEAGHKTQQMPCKHLFHPPCLAPWLANHNSCPICRYELPTDDWAYESRKEREKEEEEARKGAANTIRDDHFMYI